MDKLQITNRSQSIALTQTQVELAIQVYHVNQLTAFPLSDNQIEEWAMSINELRPNVTPEQIKEVIDGMKQGHIDFDNKLGIQNIFKALDAGVITIPMPN